MLTCFFFQKDISKDKQKLVRFEGGRWRWCTVGNLSPWPIREYRKGNQIWTIQRNWQHRAHNTICVGHHHTQANTNNVNKTLALLQTTGGKDEPNIVLC